MKSVLIVENGLSVTGAYKSIRAISDALRGAFTIHFCVHSRSQLEQPLRQAGYPLLRLPFVEVSKSIGSMLGYFPMLFINAWRMRRYCRRHGIEVVHVNDVFNMTGVVLKMIAPSIKLVYHVRLLPDSYIAPLYRVFLGRVNASADFVVFVTEAAMAEVPHDEVRSFVVHDVLPEGERLPGERIPHAGIRFLYLANFTPGKGQEYAIQAFARMKRPADCTLTMAGGDLGVARNKEYRERLKQLSKSLNQTGSITFLDFVEDVESLIKGSDVLLNFSESESFSMTCLEAMKYGTAVIASDSGGPGDLLAHGRGILVENRNVEQMSKAMELLVGDANLRQSLSAEAKGFVKDRFKVADSAKALASLYTRSGLQNPSPRV